MVQRTVALGLAPASTSTPESDTLLLGKADPCAGPIDLPVSVSGSSVQLAIVRRSSAAGLATASCIQHGQRRELGIYCAANAA